MMVLVNPSLHTYQSKILEDVVNEAVTFFVETPIHPLPPPARFRGTGVYALYYIGKEGLYGRLGALYGEDKQIPIYVGQASCSGVRQGKAGNSDWKNARLYDRLREHSRSIRGASNLALADFRCRFMIMVGVEHGLIRTVESALINRHRPLWNTYVDGFGIHDPGAGRSRQEVSEWDSIHPGRSFVGKMESNRRPTDPIVAKIKDVLKKL